MGSTFCPSSTERNPESVSDRTVSSLSGAQEDRNAAGEDKPKPAVAKPGPQAAVKQQPQDVAQPQPQKVVMHYETKPVVATSSTAGVVEPSEHVVVERQVFVYQSEPVVHRQVVVQQRTYVRHDDECCVSHCR
ncbi:hypothetical protein AAVH_06504 [Aphelenchoides avenae]|nr:hypothetical protein AAVH_06504 [Aphelenchus avenae]